MTHTLTQTTPGADGNIGAESSGKHPSPEKRALNGHETAPWNFRGQLDFFRGLERGHLPRWCDNCGRYFLLPAGKYSSYCERPLKDGSGKTCRDVGARKRHDDKCKNDPIWLAYNRAYKAHYARYMKKKMTTAQFEQWSRYVVELRSKAEAGTVEQVEYERLLKI